MQKHSQWAKVNIYNVYLVFLSLIFWVLISVGLLWILFNFLAGVFIVSAYNATPLNVLRHCALYDFVYIYILTFIYYLRKHVEKNAKRQDGTEVSDEKIKDTKGLFFWTKIYLLLLIVNYIAVYSIPLLLTLIYRTI